MLTDGYSACCINVWQVTHINGNIDLTDATNTMGVFVCTEPRMTVEATKLAAQYPSVCNASSSGWPRGLCTNAWPRNRSSRCLPAAPNQSPRSKVKHRGLLRACTEGFLKPQRGWNIDVGVLGWCTYLPLAHSLGWWRGFLVWDPAKGNVIK